MQVKDILTEDVQYVAPDTPLIDVAKRMKEHDCGAILVGESDKLSGVITDRDIVLRCVAESIDPMAMTAKECQSPEILYCYENSEIEDVLRNMSEKKVRRLPVIDNQEDKRLVGIVSFGDLSEACDNKELCGEAMEEISKAA